MFFAEPAAFFVAIGVKILTQDMDKIKTWLWLHRTDILMVLILALTVTAAFQMGRLSVIYSGQSDFKIYDSR